MIDTHAHLDLKQFNKDREKVIARCFKNGVKKIINVGYSSNIQHKNIYFAIGYHPYDIKKFDLEKLKASAGRPKIVAIGEIGLDPTKPPLAPSAPFPSLPRRGLRGGCGVIHCFTGSFKQAQKYLDLGFYLSFTGLITYDRNYDKVILNTPIEKILLETDCPFLAPGLYRGQRCEPWMVKFTAQQIAEIKNIGFDKVVEKTTENAAALFKI